MLLHAAACNINHLALNFQQSQSQAISMQATIMQHTGTQNNNQATSRKSKNGLK